jgi:hypothetical protein
MSSFFQRTRLWAQIQEARTQYSLVRRREYRFALKTQRAIVRMRVISEAQRAAIEKVRLRQSSDMQVGHFRLIWLAEGTS